MSHLVLLGDSILDNRAYVAPGRAVIDNLRAALPPTWQATLLAVDGSTVASVAQQLRSLPADASHLLLSVGGNDALMASGVLNEPASSVGAALIRLAQVQAQFAQAYRQMLELVLARNLPTLICTIYYPQMADRAEQQMMSAGLLPFNDSIMQAAAHAGLPLLDLRAICATPADFANEIEPSALGGAKIAQRALRAIQAHDFARRQASIYL
jgi:lysophospholipase L1-like esterase